MTSVTKTIEAHRPDLGPYEELCEPNINPHISLRSPNHLVDKHFHSHPELSFQEKETAAKITARLQQLDAYEVFPGIGGYGVAAVLKNGEGRTILLRADIDALPVEELSGLDYASKASMKDLDGVEKPLMHACGHDMHITALLATAETLASAKDKWKGTLILVFQPAEERAGGAQAMVEDGLYQKVPEPELAIGAHVMPYRAGEFYY